MMRRVYEFRFQFTRDFIRAALRRPFISLATKFLAIVMALLAGIVFFMTGGHVNVVLVGVMAGGIAIIAAKLVFSFRASVDRTFELWEKQSPTHEMRFALDAESISIQLEHASNCYAWKDIKRLWRYSDVWLIEVATKASVLFPATEAPDDVKGFLVERCRAAGVRV